MGVQRSWEIDAKRGKLGLFFFLYCVESFLKAMLNYVEKLSTCYLLMQEGSLELGKKNLVTVCPLLLTNIFATISGSGKSSYTILLDEVLSLGRMRSIILDDLKDSKLVITYYKVYFQDERLVGFSTF